MSKSLSRYDGQDWNNSKTKIPSIWIFMEIISEMGSMDLFLAEIS